MTTMHSTDWRRALVEAYPDIFHPHGHPPVAQGWPEIGDGWEDLLRRACRRIRAAVRADGGSFCAAQIKEKYGGLRFYWQGSLSADAVARVEEAIALAEARSATTCDVCGEEGRLRDDLWLVTRCDAHAEGRPAVAVEEGFEHLRVERTTVGGRVHVRYRRYDRAADRFVDVAPVAPGSREA